MKDLEQISKNCYKGFLILSVIELIDLANTQKSVYHSNWGIKPAAFVMSMSTRLVYEALRRERLYSVINKKDFL